MGAPTGFAVTGVMASPLGVYQRLIQTSRSIGVAVGLMWCSWTATDALAGKDIPSPLSSGARSKEPGLSECVLCALKKVVPVPTPVFGLTGSHPSATGGELNHDAMGWGPPR